MNLESEGRIDVLINNAGFGLYGPVEDIPIDDARYQFEVNLFGLAHLTQLVLPHMRAQGSGRIVNISSMVGKVFTPLAAWYDATKHALEGWSDCLRYETAPVRHPGRAGREFIQPGATARPFKPTWSPVRQGRNHPPAPAALRHRKVRTSWIFAEVARRRGLRIDTAPRLPVRVGRRRREPRGDSAMGKVILITGASAGIGREAAILMARKGHTVYAGARRMDRLAELADHGVIPVQMDVSDGADNERQPHRGLDRVLVNRTGPSRWLEDALPVRGEPLRAGASWCCRRAFRIVNVSSVGGRIFIPLGAWYHATKHALDRTACGTRPPPSASRS